MNRITILTIILALFGGMNFFVSPLVGPLFIGAGVVVLAAAVVVMWRGEIPATLLPASLILLAMSLSSMANADIWTIALSRKFIFAVAMGLMIITTQMDDIWPALYRAGLIWPPIWLAATWLGWWDNRNIVAVWSMVFIVVGFYGRRWWYLAPHLLMLLWLGSRGAALGGLAAMLVILWPGLKYTATLVRMGGVAGLVGLLVWWRPDTALYRLHYWLSGWQVFINNIWLGVGPGGISARDLITEPGGGYQVHAHNIIVTTGAELGLVGLALCGLAAWLWWRSRPGLARWQWAIIAGLLVHSLVDQPLWWPGPLLFFAMIL